MDGTMGLVTVRKRLRRNPTVRQVGIPLYRTYADVRSIRWSDPPLLANSMPKSGTHLLTSMFAQLPRCTHSGRHYELDQFERPHAWAQTGEYDWDRAVESLRSIKRGQYVSGHFPAETPVMDGLEQLGLRCVFIVRDPRDVVVSAVHYIMGHPHHPLRQRYLSECSSHEEMILATIEGRSPLKEERGWRSIGEELARYRGWLDHAKAYVVRFEDLIGPKGGGDQQKQRAEVSAIASFAGRPVSPEDVSSITKKMWGRGAATFRKGQAGDWRRHFSGAHREAFKKQAGEKLIELGYERDLNW